eukprot:723762-Pleurochrysis_carterae.AAC.1
MPQCPAEPNFVPTHPCSGPHQLSGQRPSGLELPSALPLHQWSHPSKMGAPQAHPHEPQPQ